MGKVGLVAGGGSLPLEFVRSARKTGETVVVFAVENMASPQLDTEADKVYWLNVGQAKKFVFLLLKEGIRELALVGKIYKDIIYDQGIQDSESREMLDTVIGKNDYSILEEITRRLKRIGVEVIDSSRYLSHLLPQKGVLAGSASDKRINEDIEFGYEAAKKIAGMDIGQTVIVKDKNIVAVEAMEGTDAAISRAYAVAGEGCVMVKVSRPDQDLRWDVPTVGPETLARLSEHKFNALAIESGKMFVIENEKVVKIAEKNSIVVSVL